MRVVLNGQPVTLPDQIGSYRLIMPAGESFSGLVFRARDVRTDRIVALKIWTVPGRVGERFRDALLAAVERGRAFHHPAAVRLHEAGADQGLTYLAMEWVEGEPLSRYLARKVRLPWTQAVALLAPVAHALSAGIRAGLSHGGIKPTNILVTKEGVAQIEGLGLPPLSFSDWIPVEVLRTAGLPYYTDRARLFHGGATATDIDLYFFGALLFEVLTGRTPLPNRTVSEVILQARMGWPPLSRILPGTPQGMAQMLARLSGQCTGHGYGGWGPLVVDLEGFRDSMPAEADGVYTPQARKEEEADLVDRILAQPAPPPPTGRDRFRAALAAALDRARRWTPAQISLAAGLTLAVLLPLTVVRAAFRQLPADVPKDALPTTSDPLRFARPSTATPTEVPPEMRAKNMLLEAQSFAASHPGEFARAIALFQAAADCAIPGTPCPWAEDARNRILELKDAQEKADSLQFERLQKEVAALLQWEEFGEAEGKYQEYVLAHPGHANVPAAATAIERIRASFLGWQQKNLGLAGKALADNRLDDAQSLYQEMLSQPLTADVRVQVDNGLREVRLKKADVRTQKLLAQAKAEQAELENRFKAAVLTCSAAAAQFRYADAKRDLDAFARSFTADRFPAVAETVAHYRKALNAEADLFGRTVADLHARRKALYANYFLGKSVSGQVSDADEKHFEVKLEPTGMTGRDWDDLTPEQGFNFFQAAASRISPQDQFAVAVAAFHRNLVDPFHPIADRAMQMDPGYRGPALLLKNLKPKGQ